MPIMDSQIEVTLGDTTLLLRAHLGEMRALQKRIGGLLNIARKFSTMEVTSEDLTAIIWHGAGLAERNAKLLGKTFEDYEAMVLEYGIVNVIRPCADFINLVLSEGSKGKAKPPPAEGEQK